MIISKIDKLLENRFFQGLNWDDIKCLDLDLFSKRSYQKGDIVITQDTPGREMYLITNGELVITRKNPRESIELARGSKGEYVGEMALFDGNLRSATVKAESDLEVLVLTHGVTDLAIRNLAGGQ